MASNSKQSTLLYKTTQTTKRHSTLSQIFSKRFRSVKVQFITRAPGRVNLIGEHIDYSGYAVLPVAIENDTQIGVHFQQANSQSEPPVFEIYCENVNNNTWSSQHYTLNNIESMKRVVSNAKKERTLHWTHYILAALCGVFQHLDEHCQHPVQPQGKLYLLVDGRVPPGSGLSSSSSLVCASALVATGCGLFSREKQPHCLDRIELAQLCAKCEQLVGAESGGMDQSISFLAEQGSASYIQFVPKLCASTVQLPKQCVFVLANSMQKHSVATGGGYNMRVVETRLAAMVLSKRIATPQDKEYPLDDYTKITLRSVADHYNKSLNQLLKLVEVVFDSKVWCVQQVFKLYEFESLEVFMNRFVLPTLTTGIDPEKTQLHLYARAKHVYSEAARVERFREICSLTHSTDESVCEILGELMNLSHESCKILFDCSSHNLDLVTSMALESNASGSRLTGAGWGGWTITLVKQSQLENFLKAFRSKLEAKFGDAEILITKPSQGACIFESFSDKIGSKIW